MHDVVTEAQDQTLICLVSNKVPTFDDDIIGVQNARLGHLLHRDAEGSVVDYCAHLS
jgi:hypothetical protein